MPERIVTDEQRRTGPKIGLPEGPGCFWAATASLIAYIAYGYARSSLLVSLQNHLRQTHWEFMIPCPSERMGISGV